MNYTPSGVVAMHDTRATAKILGFRPRTLVNWRVFGKGPKWVCIGGRIRYLADDINEWLLANRCSTTTDNPK